MGSRTNSGGWNFRRGPWFWVALGLLSTIPLPNRVLGQVRESGATSPPPQAVPSEARRWLERKLEGILANPDLKGTRIGTAVLREGDRELLLDERAEETFGPASNVKLLTTGAALSILGAEFEYKTQVLVEGLGSEAGKAERLIVRGSGDPSISGRHHDGDPTALLRTLARQILDQGWTECRDLVVDDGDFDRTWVHPSWPTDQLSRWYCAQIGALSLNDNCIDLTFRVGSRENVPLQVTKSPPTRYVELRGNPRASAKGTGSKIFAERKAGTNILSLGGTHPVSGGSYSTSITIHDPGFYFAQVFREILEQEGFIISGKIVRHTGPRPKTTKVIAEIRNPIARIVKTTNKRSQNFYAEQLLKTVGHRVRGEGSFEAGAQVVRNHLAARIGVPEREISLVDGSGLSKENRVSPRAFVRLLAFMLQSPQKEPFFLSLPWSGEPGASLRNRLRSESMRGRVVAKTGYITGAGSLSGYLRGASDETFVFSILINRSGWISNTVMKQTQDKICELLYEFSIRFPKEGSRG